MSFKITKSLFRYNVYVLHHNQADWLWIGSAWSLRGARKICDNLHGADRNSDLREDIVEYIVY